jgi:hypothetical protein
METPLLSSDLTELVEHYAPGPPITVKAGYPKVIGEFDTVRKLKEGFSIARYGDGEFKMADGEGYRREKANRGITRELMSILHQPKGECLVGIPTMDRAGAKYENWERHKKRFTRMVSKSVQYYSSFITRPDSAPWINTVEFAELMQSLWSGKKVAVVCEPANSILKVVKLSARKIVHIQCPSYSAYASIGNFMDSILQSRPEIALLSVGPTATCLAHRLSHKVQAIDIGSSGGFLFKLLTK